MSPRWGSELRVHFWAGRKHGAELQLDDESSFATSEITREPQNDANIGRDYRGCGQWLWRQRRRRRRQLTWLISTAAN